MDVVRTFRKEIEEYYAKIEGKDLEKLQSILLEMLKDFVEYCDKNNITYFLTGGSALGAVREKGIIRWDDDIDIAMPRKDYNIFRNTFPEAMEAKYSVEAPGLENHGFVQFMKIRKKGTVLRSLMSKPDDGVFIDIFPLEYAPNSKLMRSFYSIKYFLMKSLAYSVAFYDHYEGTFRPYEGKVSKKLKRGMRTKRMWGKILSIIPLNKRLEHFDRIVQKRPSNYMVVPSGIHNYKKECFPTDYFFPPRKALFDGIEVLIPNKTELILERFYGPTYLQPPADVVYCAQGFLDFDFGKD